MSPICKAIILAGLFVYPFLTVTGQTSQPVSITESISQQSNDLRLLRAEIQRLTSEYNRLQGNITSIKTTSNLSPFIETMRVAGKGMAWLLVGLIAFLFVTHKIWGKMISDYVEDYEKKHPDKGRLTPR